MSFDLYLHAVDGIAKLLHESGRDAVAKGMVYRDDLPVKPFCEWDDLPEKAKEGRRLMAEYVIENQGDFESLLRQATKEA